MVSLPATHSVNQILDAYAEEERAKRGPNSADRDVLDEVIMGLKEYFDKTLDKLLLYRFEREQYRTLRQKWESGGRNSSYKGPLDVYGAHHLTRLFGKEAPFLPLHHGRSIILANGLKQHFPSSSHRQTWINNPSTVCARNSRNSHYGSAGMPTSTFRTITSVPVVTIWRR